MVPHVKFVLESCNFVLNTGVIMQHSRHSKFNDPKGRLPSFLIGTRQEGYAKCAMIVGNIYEAYIEKAWWNFAP